MFILKAFVWSVTPQQMKFIFILILLFVFWLLVHSKESIKVRGFV
jgi:hypothetical protein